MKAMKSKCCLLITLLWLTSTTGVRPQNDLGKPDDDEERVRKPKVARMSGRKTGSTDPIPKQVKWKITDKNTFMMGTVSPIEGGKGREVKLEYVVQVVNNPAMAIFALLVIFALLFAMILAAGYNMGYEAAQHDRAEEAARAADDVEEREMADAAAAAGLGLGGKMREMMEEPSSSAPAEMFVLFTAAAVLASCVLLVLQSLPWLNPEFNPQNYQFFQRAEWTIRIFFSIDYITRFAVAENKVLFVIDFMNLMDFLSTFPPYVDVINPPEEGKLNEARMKNDVDFAFMRTLRLMRIFRIPRIARVSQTVALMVNALSGSGDALVLLCWFLGIGTFMLGAAIFAVEQGGWDEEKQCMVRPETGECSPFTSVPRSMYFAFTVMTTVGFGDEVAVSPFGRVLSIIGMVAGILVIAMPVAVLSSKFTEAYKEVKTAFLERQFLQTHHVDASRLVTRAGQMKEEIAGLLFESRALTQKAALPHPAPALFEMMHINIERDLEARLTDMIKLIMNASAGKAGGKMENMVETLDAELQDEVDAELQDEVGTPE